MKPKLLIVSALFLLSACSLPQWRVFQKKVPTTLSEKPPAQVEGEKQGAAFIRDITRAPVADLGKTVMQVHDVASALSASLGEPAKPVALADQAAVIATLQAGLRAKDGQLEAWKAYGKKYGGMPLEGTGINLAGPAGLLGLLGVIALCIAFPAVGYAVVRVIPLLWGYFRRSTEAINEFAAAHPDAGAKLKDTLSRDMDASHKKLVALHALPANPTA